MSACLIRTDDDSFFPVVKTNSVQQQFKVKVQNRYGELEAQGDCSSWEIFKEAITTSSRDTIPIKQTKIDDR